MEACSGGPNRVILSQMTPSFVNFLEQVFKASYLLILLFIFHIILFKLILTCEKAN